MGNSGSLGDKVDNLSTLDLVLFIIEHQTAKRAIFRHLPKKLHRQCYSWWSVIITSLVSLLTVFEDSALLSSGSLTRLIYWGLCASSLQVLLSPSTPKLAMTVQCFYSFSCSHCARQISELHCNTDSAQTFLGYGAVVNKESGLLYSRKRSTIRAAMPILLLLTSLQSLPSTQKPFFS